MFAQIENNKGIISYDDSLIDQIITEAFEPYRNNYRLIKKAYDMEEKGVELYFEVQLKFGTSIRNFSDYVLRYIGQRVENNLELTVKSIKLHITGIYSKKISKRDILIEYGNKSEITSNGY